MMKPLIWKEWHEQRWKMVFGTVMLLFFTGSLVASKVTSDKEVIALIYFLGGMILALYSAMGAFAPERANRTTAFLTSKPTAAWKVFICKWFFGWLNFVVPMLVSSLCLQWIVSDSLAILYVKGLFGALAITTIFYSMTCCFAPRKSSEAFVGFVGLLVFLFMMVHVFLSEVVFRSTHPDNINPTYFSQALIFVNPLYWVAFSSRNFPRGFNFTLFIAIQAILFSSVMWSGLRQWKRSS